MRNAENRISSRLRVGSMAGEEGGAGSQKACVIKVLSLGS